MAVRATMIRRASAQASRAAAAGAGAGDEGVAVEPLEGGHDLGQGVGPGPAGRPLLALLQVAAQPPGQPVGVAGLGQLRLERLGLRFLVPFQAGQGVGQDGLDRLGPHGGGGARPVQRGGHLQGGRPQRRQPRPGQGPGPVEPPGGEAGGGGGRLGPPRRRR